MTSSYLLTLRTLDDYTVPTNFSAYAINWGRCPDGFATVNVNNKCNNNKICVPMTNSNGRTYLNGPGYVDTSTRKNPNNRRFTKNLYNSKPSSLCFPPFQDCIPTSSYLPASQSLFDRPLQPNREVNYLYRMGESKECGNNWEYLMKNDYFNTEEIRHDGTGYNEKSRAPWPINSVTPVDKKWDAYRLIH